MNGMLSEGLPVIAQCELTAQKRGSGRFLAEPKGRVGDAGKLIPYTYLPLGPPPNHRHVGCWTGLTALVLRVVGRTAQRNWALSRSTQNLPIGSKPRLPTAPCASGSEVTGRADMSHKPREKWVVDRDEQSFHLHIPPHNSSAYSHSGDLTLRSQSFLIPACHPGLRSPLLGSCSRPKGRVGDAGKLIPYTYLPLGPPPNHRHVGCWTGLTALVLRVVGRTAQRNWALSRSTQNLPIGSKPRLPTAPCVRDTLLDME
ncbi:uncharacterized protein MELLADRAFT_96029 [Melampsora larici-populina 98AG31]|uniref:Uncharacterized protein n=1 Tax=Melampsora larici-populina (strain 98AG31 / pathotype 3-4-7) TaxID=747676 RepID=F4SAN0_MELLP|nr:uncharacterized protein MELLADRAFT_96029 [Melampsora larici-populina 98AG31]EGF98307.1 hypothetical protein MELLADRAFT_96029 [Melampsora larici-populina 98AG31]